MFIIKKIQKEIPTEKFIVTSVLNDRLLRLRFRGSRVNAKRIFFRNFYLLRLSVAYCLPSVTGRLHKRSLNNCRLLSIA